MKKIDLHLHTVPSISDSHFDFSLEKLKEYVDKLELDCIAITNHNLFDLEQFSLISSQLAIVVLPGIEIDLEGGHLLLISDNVELLDFEARCKQVQALIKSKTDYITVEDLKRIFPNLGRYLLIPHYDKKPNIKDETLRTLGNLIFAGEVTSIRKFKSCLVESDKLTPVIFSDARIVDNIKTFPTRQTFVDVGDLSVSSLKSCFSDKSKVCLSKEDGNDFFQISEDGLYLSTGLNVILGERSSGKTHTLNRIYESFENVKYIQQFSLLQNDEERFRNVLSIRNSTVTESYLKEFKEMVLDVVKVDLNENKLEVEKYLNSLLKYASESDKQDSFSKCKLFSETLFSEEEPHNIDNLIKAAITLLENVEYKDIVNKYLSEDALKSLASELITSAIGIHESNLKKRWVNDLIRDIQDDLKLRTTATFPEDVDLYTIILENEKVKKFNLITKEIQKEREINKKEIRGFKIVANTKRFTGAQQLKTISKRQLTFSNAFNKYDNPYGFLNSLKDIELGESDYYKYFVDIDYKILNKHGFPVSGGERSEFNLLHEISDALKHDILLIDEPESSFDNGFLKDEVNELIKDISKSIPVIVVTHNSTVGASIKPDYILCTRRKIEGIEIKYQVFHGYPSDKVLKCLDGETITSYDTLLKCLEAGKEAYNERRTRTYEILEN